MSSIEAHNIWKTIRGRQILAGSDLSVRAGEAVGLFGTSGAGKSTLFDIILGVIPADTGTIMLDGHDLGGLPTDARARLGLGYVPQRPFIPPQLRVREAIQMAAEGAGIEDLTGDVVALLDMLSINHLAERKLGKLSGGERRRVEIGYVLVTRPRYLLLDEPFAGLDPVAIEALIQTLRRIVERGIGILVAEHNHLDAARLVDRCYVLHDGVLHARAKPALHAEPTRVAELVR